MTEQAWTRNPEAERGLATVLTQILDTGEIQQLRQRIPELQETYQGLSRKNLLIKEALDTLGVLEGCDTENYLQHRKDDLRELVDALQHNGEREYFLRVSPGITARVTYEPTLAEPSVQE